MTLAVAPYRLLLPVALLVLSAGLGLKDPWPADEPRFALIAKEMVETGQWWIPHRASEPYPDKPPIFIWSVAVGYALSGSLRWAHLLPSLLAAMATLLLIKDLGARLWNAKSGWIAGWILLLTAQFTVQARTGQIDALLCFWTTLALWGLLRHLLAGPSWAAYSLAGFAMGLGVITKGVGFLPYLLLLPYLLARLLRWPGLAEIEDGHWRWLLAPAFTFVAIALWLVPMWWVVETQQSPAYDAYRANILWHQTAERYAQSWGHIHPPWFYLTRIPLLWLPTILLLPWLIRRWAKSLRQQNPTTLLLLGWIALLVVFFSFSAGKRGVYLLPAVPALALVTAPWLAEMRSLARVQQLAKIFLVSLTVFLALVVAARWALPASWTEVEQQLGASSWWLALLLLLCGATWLLTVHCRVLGVVGFLCSSWLLYGWVGYPLINPTRSAAPFMARVGEILTSTTELALVTWPEQLALFADRPVTHFGFHTEAEQQTRQAAAWLGSATDRRVLVPRRYLEPCFDPTHSLLVGLRHRRRWHLVGTAALTDHCRELPPSDSHPLFTYPGPSG